MARAIWSGVLSFGLVTVPVELYSATEAHEPTFHQFEKGTKDRIRYQRVNERTGKEVDFGDIVKGADVGGGEYVMLEQEELDSVAPGRSRQLQIETFVDLDQIDPIHFAKTYFLGPNGEDTKKTYALLRDAMAATNRAAIARFVMRNNEYLATVRADGDVLVLETMFFADEIRDAKNEVSDLPGKLKQRPQEMKMARQLVDSMSGPWKPSDYRDTYTDRVNKLIRAKKADKVYEPEDAAPSGTEADDLMEALRASVDAANEGGRAGTSTARKLSAGKKTAGKKSAAKKSVAKKPAAKKTSGKRKAA